MPGLRFKFCLVYAVTKHPWVQVPAGQIGVVIAQVGEALPIGAKSAVYKTGVRQLQPTSTCLSKKAGRKACRGRCCRRARWRRFIRWRSW